MQFYLNPEREQEPNALPDAETFEACRGTNRGNYPADGWYWWPFFPQSAKRRESPHGERVGPFDTEALAIADAQGGVAPEEPNPFADIDRSPTDQGGEA